MSETTLESQIVIQVQMPDTPPMCDVDEFHPGKIVPATAFIRCTNCNGGDFVCADCLAYWVSMTVRHGEPEHNKSLGGCGVDGPWDVVTL